MTDIAANLARLRDTIAATAAAVGREPDTIKLIAVSKAQPITALEQALAAGQRVFGENTVQEALGKIAHFAGHGPIARDAATNETVPQWHFIGHVQSNKARFIPANFAWLHSLDSLKLAQRLSRFAQTTAVVLDTLIEVNVTGDPRKHGIAPAQVVPLLEQLLAADLPGLRLRGLMTIGPYPAPETEIRATYAALRGLCEQASARFRLHDFTELSMGMSGDYVPAIKEGSTMLRIGTAIFGERDHG